MSGPTFSVEAVRRWNSLSNNTLAYVLFGVLLLLEFLFFMGYAEREVIWAYPNNHDQAYYLFRTYDLYTDFVGSGIGAWMKYLKAPSPQGMLFPVQGFFLCLVFGATRTACLCVNFILFGVLQACLIYTLRWLTGNIWFGFVGVGLLLSQISAFFWAGGLFDFRTDFSAYCLYGIWILVVLRSGVFSDAKWTIIAGLVAAWLILTRFVTFPYIVGVVLVTTVLISLMPVRLLLEPRERKEVLGKITRGVLCLAIAAVTTAPFLYMARKEIWNYYGVRHLAGPEKYIRAAELQIRDLTGHLTYYPKSILSDHLGPCFGLLSLALLCAVYIFRRTLRNEPAVASSDPLSRISVFPFLVATIVTPLIVLTLDISKSQVVGGIVGVPVALIVLLGILSIGGGTNSRAKGTLVSPRACAMLAAVSMAFGSWNYISHLTGHGPFHSRRAEIAQLTKVYDTIGQYVETAGWKHRPLFSVNMISDTMSAPAISVVQFERRGVLIRMTPLLGNRILAVDRDAVFRQLKQTDVLLLGDASKRFGLNEHYPFNHTVTPLSGDIEQWARQELVCLVSTSSVEGRGYRVYVRPSETAE
ncbi:MAG: hypothetical protein HY913_15105 [Desulfomonile tiedjei]|nr:hypothetical protein [Desulfomonile tiedjei]